MFASAFQSEISPRFWEWKYGAGRGRSVLARDAQGELAAHYGAMVRRIELFGEPAQALQSCDVMVRKKDRGILTRRGVFFETARAFQERYLNDPHTFKLAYGFPQARAMRLPTLLGLYREVDRVTQLTWQSLGGKDLLSPSVEILEGRDKVLGLADRLWRRMEVQLGQFIVVTRDANYLRYRYLNHPEFTYRFLVVRKPWTRRVLGLLIIKQDGESIRVMDLLAGLTDIPDVVRAIQTAMMGLGIKDMTAWVATSQLPYFEGTAHTTEDIDVRIPDHGWTPGLRLESIRCRWWISLGDTDFA